METEDKEKTASKKSRGSGSCCSVASCKNTGKTKLNARPEIKFHRFPKDPDVRREWVRKCGRKDRFNPETGTICSDHFAPEDYKRDLRAELLGLGDDKKKLSPDAVPCRNLPPEIQRRIRKRRDRELTEGEKLANRKRLVEEAIQWAESLPPKSPENVLGNSNAQKKTLNSTVTVTNVPGMKPNFHPNNVQLLKKLEHDLNAIHVIQLSEPTPVGASKSISSKQTQSTEMSDAEESPETAMTIDYVDTSSPSSPINLREENSNWDNNTYKTKYAELLSNFEELNTKYKRCYKVLCCFKIAYTKLRSQNNTAKTKIIDLRQKNRNLQRQLKQKNDRKSQKLNKFVQTETADPFENDVSGWW